MRWSEGGRKRGRSFDRRRDAERFEGEVRRRKAMGGIVIVPERVTVSQLHDRYVAHLESKGRERNTLEGYAAMWKHLEPRIGRVPLVELRPGGVEELGFRMVREGVGPCSASKAIGFLSSMMNRAVVWDLIERNPCEHVERPRSGKKRKVRALSPAQIEAIRSHMDAGDRAFVSVMGYSGLRPGEALALTWEHVGPSTIAVEAAVAHGELKSTKNRKERRVRLLPSLKHDLDEWRMNQGRPDQGPVFPARDGGYWDDGRYRRWRMRRWQPAVEAAGMSDVVPYGLRHSFASLLLASGAPLPEVAYEMGHTVGVLQSTYAHVIHELKGQGTVDPEQQIRIVRADSPDTRSV